MASRSVPIRRSGVRNNSFLGGDRESVMLTGLASMASIVPAINSLKAWAAGSSIWFAGTIAVVIAIFGAASLAVLAFASFANAAERKSARYRSKDEGLADSLNYGAMVDDGVIVGKNGSFMAAWIYEGDDNASSTDRQRDMVSFR
ncbi:hypothetical protein OY671_007747, partial [Metschnikowia pulcherrima]